jgi:ERF superfamily protein
MMAQTLAQKIHAIQSIARKVAKRGVNPEQGWEYLQIEDAVLAAKRMMKKYGLILTGSLSMNTNTQEFAYKRVPNDKGSGYVVDLVMEWSLEDVESGERHIYFIPGSGWDYNDKGVFKAMTGSRKYAIVLIFNLAVGNDVEERGAMDKTNARDRQKEILDQKLADAEAGRGVEASTPQLFYQWFDESKTALITGDKELAKQHSDLLKAWKIGGKTIVNAATLERIRLALEERGVSFTQLRA